MPDGSIIISTELDNKNLERQLAKAKREIEKLEQTVSDQETKKSPLVGQARELEQRIKAARAEVQKYGVEWESGVAGADKSQMAAIATAQQLETQHAGVVGQIDKIDAKLAPAYEKLDAMKTSAGGLEQELAKAGYSSEQMDKATRRAAKSLDKFKSRLREVVRSALIFTVITQSLAKFRDWVGGAIKANDKAVEAVARLKGALLTLAQPLVEIIIPAFTTLVNVLADLVGVVASILSTLFGSTVKDSAEAAEGLQDEQDAIQGVGDAAKKAGKSLANFDEINKLSGDTASSKGEIAPNFSGVGNMEWLKETLGDAADLVSDALLLGGVALIAIGASMGNLPLVVAGLAAIGSGLAIGSSTGALRPWADALGLNHVQEFVAVAVTLAGIALVAIGAAMGNIFLVIAGLGIIWTTVAYTQTSGMMNSWTENQVSRAAAYVTAALLLGGIVLVAIGAATANILMVIAGLGLLAAGVYVGVKSGTLRSWAEVLGLESVFDYVVVAIQLAGIVMIAIGAATANLAMVIAGAIILSAGSIAEVLGEQTLQDWWEVLKLTSVEQWLGVALLLVGVVLIALGAAMANILMVVAGAAMIGAGTVVSLENNNFADWVTALGLEKVVGWVTVALMLAGMAFIAFGILSANVLMVVAGIGLLVAGYVVGTESGSFGSWVDALHLNEVPGWVSTALQLAGIAFIAIGAMMMNPLMIIAGLALLGVGTVLRGANASKGSMPKAAPRSYALPSVAQYKIPALARGAVIPPNREFMAVLGDQKSGTNIEAPLSTIEEAVGRAVEQRGGGVQEIAVTVHFDGTMGQLARLMKPHIDAEGKRSGVKLVGVTY